jgi:hypothetical protein
MTLTAAETGCVAASADCWRPLHPQIATVRNNAGAAARRENQAEKNEADVCTLDLFALEFGGPNATRIMPLSA